MCRGCAGERDGGQQARGSWLLRKKMVHGVAGEAGRRDLIGGKAQKSGAGLDTRRFRVRESRFMPQR